MIHAKMPDSPAALCIYLLKRMHLFPSAKTTSRYSLVTCSVCRKALLDRPQLRNASHVIEKAQGETGTLDAQAGTEESEAYWQARIKEGAEVPPWARALYKR